MSQVDDLTTAVADLTSAVTELSGLTDKLFDLLKESQNTPPNDPKIQAAIDQLNAERQAILDTIAKDQPPTT